MALNIDIFWMKIMYQPHYIKLFVYILYYII